MTSGRGAANERDRANEGEYQRKTSTGSYSSSLARLLDGAEHGRRLQGLLVDHQPPVFLSSLHRLVITKRRDIQRPLEELQQWAQLRVMRAEGYLLNRSCPTSHPASLIKMPVPVANEV